MYAFLFEGSFIMTTETDLSGDKEPVRIACVWTVATEAHAAQDG